MWLYTLPAMVYQSDCSVVSRFHLTLYSDQMYDAVRIVSGPREGVRLWLAVARFETASSSRVEYRLVSNECYQP